MRGILMSMQLSGFILTSLRLTSLRLIALDLGGRLLWICIGAAGPESFVWKVADDAVLQKVILFVK